MYQSGTYNSFNVGSEPSVWTVEAQTDGTFKIANNGYFIQWGDGTYTTFGVYTEKKENTVLPFLYQLDEKQAQASAAQQLRSLTQMLLFTTSQVSA